MVADDLALALVEHLQAFGDQLTNFLMVGRTYRVRASVRCNFEHRLLARHVPRGVVILLGYRAGVILHDRPTGVGAEFVAASVIESLDGSHERHVAVADGLEESRRPADMFLGDADDQSEVGLNDTLPDRIDLAHKIGGALELGLGDTRRIDRFQDFVRLIFQEIVSPEQILLLLAREQRRSIKRFQIRRQPLGDTRRGLRLGCGLGSVENDLIGVGCVEQLVMHPRHRRLAPSSHLNLPQDRVDFLLRTGERHRNCFRRFTVFVASPYPLVPFAPYGLALIGE